MNTAKHSKRGTAFADKWKLKTDKGNRIKPSFTAGEVVGVYVCANGLLLTLFPIDQETTMAKICFMREGLTGRLHPVAEKPLIWCIEMLGLQRKDWWANLETQFTIDKWLELSGYSRLRWVLIRLEEIEASEEWESGYYFSPMMKVDQVKKLIA